MTTKPPPGEGGGEKRGGQGFALYRVYLTPAVATCANPFAAAYGAAQQRACFEKGVIGALAFLLGAALPDRTPISQEVLDALAAGYNELAAVRDVLASEPVRLAVEGEP